MYQPTPRRPHFHVITTERCLVHPAVVVLTEYDQRHPRCGTSRGEKQK